MKTRGKGIRPTLTLLCAKLGDKPLDENGIRAAVIVEMLHEATLVHDDVVDESSQRRGFPSLSSKFRNKVSVLFGDYMLSSVLAETVSVNNFKWLQILSETARRMARGELLGAARAKKFTMNEEDYISMIKDKTAALFSACCRLGGLVGGLPDEMEEPLGIYGESIGIAFQIQDDLLDLFGDGKGIGKPIGGDLKERKLTLPLMIALSRADKRVSGRIKARIRRGVKRKEVAMIADFVREYDGDTYAIQMMHDCEQAALTALESLPKSDINRTLADIARFVVSRQS